MMLGIELVVTATLCFASGDFHISISRSCVENNECFGVWPKHSYLF